MWRCHLGCRRPVEPVWSGEAAPPSPYALLPRGAKRIDLVLTGLSPLRASAKENVLQKHFAEMADIGWALWARGSALPHVCSFQTQAEGQRPPQTTLSPSGAETRRSQLRTRLARPTAKPRPAGWGVCSVHGRPWPARWGVWSGGQRGLQDGKGENLLERAVWKVRGAVSAPRTEEGARDISFPLTSRCRAPDSELTGAGLDLGTSGPHASSHLETRDDRDKPGASGSGGATGTRPGSGAWWRWGASPGS